jgi:gluconate 5-dehydrogenase
VRVQQLFDLSGTTAIVTGGHRGIGFHIARGLAEAGSNIVVAARSKEACEKAAKELSGLGVKTLAVQCDIQRADDIEHLAEEAAANFGTVDVLFNNAGVGWAASPEDMPLDQWNRVIETNLTGTFLCCQKIGKIMIRQKKGKIINIVSVGGFVGSPSMNAVGYSSSKGGIIALTRDLAIKWVDHNIQVNGIAPGLFPTKMTEFVKHPSMTEVYKRLIAEIPMKRMGTEEDIKGVAVLLASRASDYITGHIIPVEGGFLAW